MEKHFLVMIAMLSASLSAWATPCTTGVVSSYTASGFTCDVGNLQFNNFSAYGNFYGSDQYRTANAPDKITITPVNSAAGMGFTLSNMNLSFTGGYSNTSASLYFDVVAQSGLITGSSIELGSPSFSGDGYVIAQFQGALAYLSSSYNILNGSTNFTGVSSLSSGVGVSVGESTVRGPGNAYLDGYTMLFQDPPAPTGTVPEPGSALLLVSGLLLLATRRKASGNSVGQAPVRAC